MKVTVFLLLFAFVHCEKNQKLLLFLLDGLRWDYLDRSGLHLPGFNQIIWEGVKADYMIPDMPTLSYPNYYSLMTGLHVENHGMSGNYMYDAEHKTYFLKAENPEQIHPYWWNDAEPLWVTAVKQGRLSYMYQWPGCEVEIRGHSPTFCKKLKRVPTITDLHNSISDGVRVLHNDQADLVGIYVELIDDHGHKYGPDSKEVNEQLKLVDTELERLLHLLKQNNLHDSVNIMIFSDHGMTEISQSRVVNITEYINMDDIDVILEKGPSCYVWPKENKLEKVYLDLKKMNNPNVAVYKKNEIPDLWFYKTHPRISPILLVAENGWVIITPRDPEFLSYTETGPMKGYHGYDKAEEDMLAIFVATGPAFKKNHRVKAFTNINLYQIMCHLLNIQANPHNGTWSEVKDMLIDELSDNRITNYVLGVVCFVLFTFIYLIWRKREISSGKHWKNS